MNVTEAINKGKMKNKEAKDIKLKKRLAKDDPTTQDFIALVDFHCSEARIQKHYRSTVKNGNLIKQFLIRRDYHIQNFSENPQDFIRLSIKYWKDFCTDKRNFWGAVFFYFDLERLLVSARSFSVFKEFLFESLMYDSNKVGDPNRVHNLDHVDIDVL